MRVYIFFITYTSQCVWLVRRFRRPECLAKFVLDAMVFWLTWGQGKKGHQKKCGRCPSPLRLRFDTAVYYCVNHSACMYLLVLTESVCSEWATVVCTRCCYRVGWWLDATGECHLVDCAQIKAVVLKSQVDFVSSTSSFHTEYLLVNCSIHEQILYFSLRRGLKYDLSWTAHVYTIHTK